MLRQHEFPTLSTSTLDYIWACVDKQYCALGPLAASMATFAWSALSNDGDIMVLLRRTVADVFPVLQQEVWRATPLINDTQWRLTQVEALHGRSENTADGNRRRRGSVEGVAKILQSTL